MICDICKQDKEDTHETINTYLKNMFDIEEKIYICNECYNDKVKSI